MAGEEPRAPGWYPDPWGGDGERYFDGTSWGRDAVDPLPAPQPKRGGNRTGRIVGGIVAVGVLAAIVSFGLSGGSGDESSDVILSTTTTTVVGRSTTTTRPTLTLSSYAKGDCATWDQPAHDSPVHIVACTEPHLIELIESQRVTASFDHFPTEAEWDYINASVCGPVVEHYLNSKLDPQGRYLASSVTPSSPDWATGRRTIECGIIVASNQEDRSHLIPFSGKVDASNQYDVVAPGSCLPSDGAGGLGTAVPCTLPHIIEVTGAVDLTGRIDHAPSEAERRQLLENDCKRFATTYLGRAPSGDLLSSWFGLDPGAWDAGHRTIECTVGRYNGSTEVTLTAPLR